MTETEICAYCLTSENPIDVRGSRFLKSGSQVSYLVCHTCCTTLRRHNFNDEQQKMKEFWNQVWQNLSLDECIEPIEEKIAEIARDIKKGNKIAESIDVEKVAIAS